LLTEKTQQLTIGDPLERQNWLGPVINERAVKRFEQAVAEARRDGRVVIGGERLKDNGMERGYFLQPTVVTDLAHDHRILREELFVPCTAVAAVDSVDEGIARANDSIYGLTAGFFSEDRSEVDAFLSRIEAGVVYVNRRAGATTGAWPGIQPFGGWKGSGSTGKAGGGPYYVQQFAREQSQTIVD
jgi:1-pyrroline-5-carboxylate dehydrogenase